MTDQVKKNVIVLAGPSGVGKSTLSNILLNYSDKFKFSVSATTRQIRLGEKNGVDYYFFSPEEFNARKERGEFIEFEEVYPGKFYGTLNSEISRIIDLNNIAIFDIDVLGALAIKKHYGDAAYIVFIKPESIDALEQRLRSRASDSDEDIQMRIDRFEKELSYEDQFDQTLVNKTGDIQSAKDEIIAIAEKNFLNQP